MPKPWLMLFLLCGAALAQSTGPRPTTAVMLYFVALGDNGAHGQAIGCQDSLIAVPRNIAPTIAPLRPTLQAMLQAPDVTNFTVNTLRASSLKISSVVVKDRVAFVKLSGRLRLGGVCDAPRVKAQLEQSILQFRFIQKARIFINGVILERVLSAK